MVGVQRYQSGWRLFALVAVASLAAATAAVSVSLKGFAVATEPDISFQPVADFKGTEPFEVEGGTIVAHFVDLDNVGVQISAPVQASGTIPLCGNTDAYTATIDWGDGAAADSATVTCDNSGTSQYEVSSVNNHTYKDSGTYHISVTVDDRPAGSESPHDADTAPTAKAIVDDASISTDLHTVVRSEKEGALVEGDRVEAGACFLDSNFAFAQAGGNVDPGLTATINWGDGSTTSSTSTGSGVSIFEPDSECGDVAVTGSHVYDANIPATKTYSVTITLNDDGGKSATSLPGNTPAFADAKLTAGAAKSFTSTATQASTNVVASFTDAAGAQAAAADFTATINWGDNTTSSGTVTKTAAGAFDVSGTHTFATSGTKTLTITVTDEEGQTLTMSATATVPALPATGRPSSSGGAGWPLLPAALILLGLVGVSAGLIRARLTAR